MGGLSVRALIQQIIIIEESSVYSEVPRIYHVVQNVASTSQSRFNVQMIEEPEIISTPQVQAQTRSQPQNYDYQALFSAFTESYNGFVAKNLFHTSIV